jgi:hypothetical protein
MKIGTKSLLIGVHQILWHPVTVLLAWIELYGFPNWKQCVCIFIHDWGYWGSPNMDGIEGEKHTEWAAAFADKYLDGGEGNIESQEVWPILNSVMPKDTYRHLCLFHSRHYSRKWSTFPSRLCWADKLSIKYDPWWFYLTRAWLSGELFEYRALHDLMGENFKTHREWYEWAKERAVKMGYQQNSNGISFHPQHHDSISMENAK